jgi:hypothetical protein
MDKDIRDKHYQVVGAIQALETLAKFTECMPSDRSTGSMLIAARGLLEGAVTSALAYADRQTTEPASSPGEAPEHG